MHDLKGVISAKLVPSASNDHLEDADTDMPLGQSNKLLFSFSCNVCKETEFNWKPCDCTHTQRHGDMKCGMYFNDNEDPRREPFDPTLDYGRDKLTGEFADARVQNLVRNNQLGKLIHDCTFTCLTVVPLTHNAHLNAHFDDPLLFIAHHGNCDCKAITNASGMPFYVGSYISKSERPDIRKISTVFAKKLFGIEERQGESATDKQVTIMFLYLII